MENDSGCDKQKQTFFVMYDVFNSAKNTDHLQVLNQVRQSSGLMCLRD